MTVDWYARAEALIDNLTSGGHLRNPEWRSAFAATPRHLFVPRILLDDGSALTAAEPQRWLDAVYSDESLVTRQRPHGGVSWPISSSSMPSLMVDMLEAVDIQDGHRVLEIGTGTGYNAALLCHRLGDDKVTSIDLDPDLVSAAQAALAALGHRPTLVAGDGAKGVPERAPFDRIIVTAAVSAIPTEWITQLASGGKLLVNLRGELAGGTLCLLTKEDDDELVGPVLPICGHFMWMRSTDSPLPFKDSQPAGLRDAVRTTTAIVPDVPIDDAGFRFLLQVHVPGIRSLHRGPAFDAAHGAEWDAICLAAIDGSHAFAFTAPDLHGRYRVIQAGSGRLWDSLHAVSELWRSLGRPAPERYGVVANPGTQFVWLDSEYGWYSWPLPLL